jgi:hypothetical protein
MEDGTLNEGRQSLRMIGTLCRTDIPPFERYSIVHGSHEHFHLSQLLPPLEASQNLFN